MSKTYLLALVLLLAFVGLGCRGDRRQETQTSSQRRVPGRSRSSADDVKETYAVYNALLGTPDDATRGESARHSHYVLMADQTSAEKLCFDPATQSDPRLRAAAQDFMKQNSEPRPISANQLNIGSKVELISSRERETIF